MNKNYLPYYNSLKERDKIFWLGQDKETLIDHIISNINNSEVLLSRIEQAKEYIKQSMYDLDTSIVYCELERLNLEEIIKILDGERCKK